MAENNIPYKVRAALLLVPLNTDCLDAIQKLLQTTILRTAGHTAA